MDYNTQQKRLVLPEYGRNIQNMVDYCVAIKDAEERKKCAYAIIDIMGSMFPHLRDVSGFKHILWDHLAIMSGFKLDIEYPYEVVKEEDLMSPPEQLEYSRPTMKYRHYGKILEKMVKIASEMEEGEKRDQFIKLVAIQMKKSYGQWNKGADDTKILEDLYELSEGKINLLDDNYSIPEVKVNASKKQLKNIRSQRRK